MPQKSVSSSLEFFMKPAPCILDMNMRVRPVISTTAPQRNHRRPYVLPDFSKFLNLDPIPTDSSKTKLCICGTTILDRKECVSKSNSETEVTVPATEKETSKKSSLQDMILKLTKAEEEKVRACPVKEDNPNCYSMLKCNSDTSP